MRNPNRCPSCGEHVSPFAAGCAICGVAARSHPPANARRRPLVAADLPLELTYLLAQLLRLAHQTGGLVLNHAQVPRVTARPAGEVDQRRCDEDAEAAADQTKMSIVDTDR
jgi:hypothetical protein